MRALLTIGERRDATQLCFLFVAAFAPFMAKNCLIRMHAKSGKENIIFITRAQKFLNFKVLASAKLNNNQ